jgi:hypothetical protein
MTTITLPIRCNTVKRIISASYDIAAYGVVIFAIAGWITAVVVLIFFTDSTGHGTLPRMWDMIVGITMIVGCMPATAVVLFSLPNFFPRVNYAARRVIGTLLLPLIWIYREFPRFKCIKDEEQP